ncbi:tetratricopeptide repeat protein [Rubripirellula lacrimiformis]|uniref:Tetratricopeptide repeat protein n=1 Tax=Rubripirellula lacrimiformis TaxID=1930273 RepID=A0A517NIK0_9BACT|nr:tetratricopeptide repeat protein [Rubripirellula lacrimiformis]
MACLFFVVFPLALTGCRDHSHASSNEAFGPGTVDIDQNLEAAITAWRSGDHQQAGKRLKQILIVSPTHADALFMLGRTQAAQGKIETAIDTVSEIPPGRSEVAIAALGQSANWFIQLGRYQEAESHLRALIEVDNDSFVAHRRLAELLNNQGLRSQAIPHMRSLARIGQPTEYELYGMTTFRNPFTHFIASEGNDEIRTVGLGIARRLLSNGKTDQAAAMVKTLMQQSPESTAVYAFYGRILVDRQDDAALAAWLASPPPGIDQQPEYWAAVGQWYQRHNKHSIAVRCFSEAVLRDDTDRHSYLAMARSLQAIDHTEEAAKVMQRYSLLDEVDLCVSAIKRTPDQIRRLPIALSALRRHDEAKAWCGLPEFSAARLPTPKPASDGADHFWVTCGIDPSRWPLPDINEPAISAPHSVAETPSSSAPIVLANVAERSQLDMQYLPGPAGTDLDRLLLHQTVGGGVAVLDYDLDGCPDLYFSQSGGAAFDPNGSAPNALFRNHDGKTFARVESLAQVDDRGYGQGVSAGDLNQDGFPDLLVANIGVNQWFINNGDGTFTRRSLSESNGSNRWTTSIACGDVTGDTLPDIVEANYIDDAAALVGQCWAVGGQGLCNPNRYNAATDRTMVATIDGNFKPLATESLDLAGYGFAIVIGNIDQQFGNDIFIANDTDPNHLWQSHPLDPSPTQYGLQQVGTLIGCGNGTTGNPNSCMGVAVGDFDRNGQLDLHVTNYTDESSDLFLQQSSRIFTNSAVQYGLEEATTPMVGWGTQASDFNADGWLDLAILNGHLYSALNDGTPYRMPPQIFRGGKDRFHEATTDSRDDSFWKTATVGRTLATTDWNRDGKTDLVAYNIDTPAALLENRSQGGHWLQLELVGTSSERSAVGAIITATCAGESWTRWVTSGDGFQCKNESILHVGLGQTEGDCRIDITWPSGNQQTFDRIPINQRYLAIENDPQLHSRDQDPGDQDPGDQDPGS